MRLNGATGEPVLAMDYRACRRVMLETSERWDPEELRKRQAAFVIRYWPIPADSWTTAVRDEGGTLRYYSEDF
jgi:hypothetical protein